VTLCVLLTKGVVDQVDHDAMYLLDLQEAQEGDDCDDCSDNEDDDDDEDDEDMEDFEDLSIHHIPPMMESWKMTSGPVS
jgi:hypothetical protein